MVFLLVLGLSILPLLWFGRNWSVPSDGSMYLLLGWNLISGEGYTLLGDLYTVRGPVFPGFLGGLMLLVGRDLETLAWVVRLLALANPVLMYFLVKRIAGPIAGLLAAAMVAFFSHTATFEEAFTIDAVQLTVYLLAVLMLLVGVQRDSAGLSLLSGLLLGTVILTKETSLTVLPLALFAALLLGWSFRRVLLHYAGVAAICLPWWVWVWAVSGEVYPLGNSQQARLVIPIIVALAVIALFVVGLYRYGIATRLLANERWRRGIGWFVVLAPVTAFSVLLLSTVSSESMIDQPTFEYIVGELGSDIRLWYLLPFAGIYIIWETVRGNRLWGVYLVLLVLQVPVLLIVLGEQWGARQWLIAQTLLLGALAGLTVKVFGASIRKERHGFHRALGFGAAAVLVVFLVQAAVSQVRYLFDDVYVKDDGGNIFHVANSQANEINPSVRDMYGWIAENIPEGEKIVTTRNYASQLAFLDGMQHGWSVLQMDGCDGAGRLAAARCRPSKKIAQAPPQPAVWFEMDDDCNGTALSLTSLMRQMERSGAKYLLMTQEKNIKDPINLAWAPYLKSSGAFETVYSSYLPDAPTTEQSYGLVLLKRTGREPTTPAPALMRTNTVEHLIRCEKADWGERYAERIRKAFPNGIEVVGGQSQVESTQRAIGEIYGT
ncbi:MAG: glycosyltransferase family 39 protein [Rubrobacter sp.]|nr:glycosyltransferase family 39 protein [Rubrobacter sp.]